MIKFLLRAFTNKDVWGGTPYRMGRMMRNHELARVEGVLSGKYKPSRLSDFELLAKQKGE